MNKFRKIIPLLIVAIGLVISCNNDDEDKIAAITEEPPTAATLLFPENNSECNEGIIISETETDVMFKWLEATNASSYILQITNLNSGNSRNISTTTNEFLIRILRGIPYSWSIKSKNGNSTMTAESEVWKFYNAGLPEQSYPPFPAEAMSPKIGSSIEEGSIELQWQATDIDNDIDSYKVLLDTNNPPITEVGNVDINNLNVSVYSGFVYYWKVITFDTLGNSSDSQIFEFRVN